MNNTDDLDEIELLFIRRAEGYLAAWDHGEAGADYLLAAQAAATLALAAGQRLTRQKEER